MENEVIDAPAATAVQVPTQAQLPAQARQLSVVEYAIQRGASVQEVQAIVELKIQMDNHALAMRKHDDERERELRAEAARNAYAAAMAAFKAEAVKVIRSKEITDGPLKGKKHADLQAVCNAATEAMSKHGLSSSWTVVEDTKEWIRVACNIKHVAGFSESTTFGGPIDNGPGRNAIQARKSTVTYLERITMLLALGLAENDADDDGAGGPKVATDITELLVGLGATATDAAAAAYWQVNKGHLDADKVALKKFKDAVVAHRMAMKKGAP